MTCSKPEVPQPPELGGAKFQARLISAQEPDGVVGLHELATFGETLFKSFKAVESELALETGSGGQPTGYRVLRFGYGSPGVLEVESKADLGEQIFHRFIVYLHQVRAGLEPDAIAYPTLKSLERLARLHQEYKLMEFRNGAGPAVIDERTLQAIRALLARCIHSHGTIKGRLDTISVHKGVGSATLFPPAGPESIQCRFEKSRYPDIGMYLGRSVIITGRLKFFADRPFPVEVDVEAISMALMEPGIAGSMPGLTGGLSPAEYVRKIRDGEEAP